MNAEHPQRILKLKHLIRHRLRPLVLITIALTVSIGLFLPGLTVKGLVVTTPISGFGSISVDSNRIAGLLSSTSSVFVYDILTATSVTFPPPLALGSNPLLSGNRIVMASATGTFASSNLYYCDMPIAAALTACPASGPGSWTLIVSGTPPFATMTGGPSFAAWGFPVFSGDLVAWPVTNGFSYFRFSLGTTTTVSLGPAVQPFQLSTDGVRIAYVALGSLFYVDTSSCVGPCPGPFPAMPVSTGLPASTTSGTSVFHYVIAFDEPTSPQHIRYYDIRTGTANVAGAGPIGSIYFGGVASPGLWEDRIAFQVTESDLGFDCNSDGAISSTQYCLRYWNIRSPNVLLLPNAAPPLSTTGQRPVGINDKTIAFAGPTGSLQYVKVPMQGDVDLDGNVDIIDIATAAICFGQVLKNVVGTC